MTKQINNPQDYLSQVNYDLQTSLGIKDTKLLSSGALSVLANMLSNIAFDAQKYYEYITKEFNVATAQNFKSMLFHASVYSYNFNLALPSEVTSYIIIPKNSVSSDRKIVYKIPSYTDFTLNDTPFRIEGEINIEITSDSIGASLTDDIGTYKLDIAEGTDENNKPVYYIIVPSHKVRQLERIVDKFVVPSYEIGDNVSYNLNIPDGNQIYLMRTFVNPSTEPEIELSSIEKLPIDTITNVYPNLEKFDLKYFKFNTTSNDKVIFVDLANYQNVTFTLGNGLRGRKLSTNDEVITVIEYCRGNAGNVPAGKAQINDVYYYEIDTNTNDTVVFNTVNLSVKTNIPASGGMNASDIEDIRFGILKKITERDSLITQLDFEKYFADKATRKLASVISRQIDTSSPIVTVYNILRDPYDYEIVKSTTLNIETSSLFTSNYWAVNPQVTYNSIDLISPFVYIDVDDKVTSYYKYNDIEIPLTVYAMNSHPEIDIKLHVKWDENNEIFYFESNAFDSNYTLEIKSNVGVYNLNSSNNFRADISHSDMIYNRFFDSNLIINSVQLKDINSDYVLHHYNVVGEITVMKKIQKHKKYIFTDSVERLLFMPFIDKEVFDKFENDSKYENTFVEYFTIGDNNIHNKLAFNINLNQGLMNTIDVDSVVAAGVKINDNNDLLAKYPVSIDIRFDNNALGASGLTLINLKNDISLAVLGYLNEHEGDGIEIYTTALIKLIKEMYPEIIEEVIINSPKTLVVEKWSRVIEENNISNDTQLNSVPTYFHFDINNMQINFKVI